MDIGTHKVFPKNGPDNYDSMKYALVSGGGGASAAEQYRKLSCLSGSPTTAAAAAPTCVSFRSIMGFWPVVAVEHSHTLARIMSSRGRFCLNSDRNCFDTVQLN